MAGCNSGGGGEVAVEAVEVEEGEQGEEADFVVVEIEVVVEEEVVEVGAV